MSCQVSEGPCSSSSSTCDWNESHAGVQAEWLSLLLATMPYLLFVLFTCEARCLLGLQNAYLLLQPLGQIVLLLGSWVKLIGSRRCVLSAGDPGHRFYIICTGLLTSSPPFMAFSLQEGHSVQIEASCFISYSCNLESYLSIVGDNFFFVLLDCGRLP